MVPPTGDIGRFVEFRTCPDGVYVVMQPGASAYGLERILALVLDARIAGLDLDAIRTAWKRSDATPVLIAPARASAGGAGSLDAWLHTSESNGEVSLVIDPAARRLTLSELVAWLNARHFSGLDLDLIRQALKGPRGVAHRITCLCGNIPKAGPSLVPAERVLLAAADGKTLTAIASLAARRGLDVRYASAVEITIFEATQRQPDAIVIDVSIGASNALAACRQLAHDVRTAAIPVLVSCKEATRMFVSQALQAGARDVMVHPISAEVATRKLTRVLEAGGKALPERPGSRGAAEVPSVLGRLNLERLLNDASPLHGMPAVVERVVRISGDSQAGSGELAHALRMDDSATTLVLRVANSAAYGGAKRITSLDDAVTRIGFRQTRSLVVGNGIVQSFGKETQAVGFDRGGCWRHALATAILSKQIAEHTRQVSIDAAFIAGLVHDVGRVLLDEFCPTEFEDAVRHALQHNVSLTEAEREVLQTTHVDVATQALRKWNFPAEIVDAVKYHHGCPGSDENESNHLSLCHTIRAADALARATGIGRGGVDTLMGEIPDAIWTNLALSAGFPDTFWSRFVEEFRASHAFLGLPIEDSPAFTGSLGVGVLWDEDASPISIVKVALEAAGWRVEVADKPGVLPAACAGAPAFLIVRARTSESLSAAVSAWQPVAGPAPLVCVAAAQGTAPGVGACLTEPYDLDVLLQSLTPPRQQPEAKTA